MCRVNQTFLGKKISLKELDLCLKKNFNDIFDNDGLFKLK